MSAARKRGRPETPSQPYSDLGPRIRQARQPGALVSSVVVEYRPDPAAPQGVDVKGACAVIIHQFMYAERLLTYPQHEAAERYLTRAEQASGAVECLGARIRGGGGQGTPTERQVSALADLRLADAALGRDRDMVFLIVAQNREPRGGVPVVRFQAAMERLARLWEL